MSELELKLLGWHLATAEIFYHMPDHYDLIQLYIWQDYDLPPRLPRLNGFLRFWTENLDGPLHSVRVAVRGLISPTDLKVFGGEFRLN